MKRFNITVNGKAYDVAVEEVTDGSAPVVATAPVSAPKPAPAPATAPAPPGAGCPRWEARCHTARCRQRRRRRS